jgi:hypothetical protein
MNHANRSVVLSIVFCIFLSLPHALFAQAPEKETALSSVVLFRPKHLTGGGASPHIFCDSKEVAKLTNGRYMTLHLAPGDHIIESKLPPSIFRRVGTTETIKVSVQAGETYYIQTLLGVQKTGNTVTSRAEHGPTTAVISAGKGEAPHEATIGVPHRDIEIQSEEVMSAFVLKAIESSLAMDQIKSLKPIDRKNVVDGQLVSIVPISLK